MHSRELNFNWWHTLLSIINWWLYGGRKQPVHRFGCLSCVLTSTANDVDLQVSFSLLMNQVKEGRNLISRGVSAKVVPSRHVGWLVLNGGWAAVTTIIRHNYMYFPSLRPSCERSRRMVTLPSSHFYGDHLGKKKNGEKNQRGNLNSVHSPNWVFWTGRLEFHTKLDRQPPPMFSFARKSRMKCLKCRTSVIHCDFGDIRWELETA